VSTDLKGYLKDELISWLLEAGEPWTRYRTLVELLDRPEGAPDVASARAELVAHPQVQGLVAEAVNWPGCALKRHNDAGHALYKLSTLADFGLRADDPGMTALVEAVMAHQAAGGAFQSMVSIPKAFGGTGEEAWTWMSCDAPTLLYALLAMGLGDDARVQRAVEHLVGLVEGNGWRCAAAPELGRFRGPGRKGDPCPIANVYALKALSLVPELLDSPATRTGVGMLLGHWERQSERKIYLFGIGSDFRKLKYPYVWYDIMHVVEVLSRFPFARADSRLGEMVEGITSQADAEGRYTATSMYRAWKGWSFADKKRPSAWLTFLVARTLKRVPPQSPPHLRGGGKGWGVDEAGASPQSLPSPLRCAG
jgi:hypothetical protein